MAKPVSPAQRARMEKKLVRELTTGKSRSSVQRKEPKRYKLSEKKNPKPKRGPIPILIDWDEVKRMANAGCTQDEIAAVVGLTRQGLCARPEFFPIWYQAYMSGRVALRRAQYELAVDFKNPTMQIWLGKQMLDQTDRIDQRVATIVGTNTEEMDWSSLSTEELLEMQRLVRKATNGNGSNQGGATSQALTVGNGKLLVNGAGAATVNVQAEEVKDSTGKIKQSR